MVVGRALAATLMELTAAATLVVVVPVEVMEVVRAVAVDPAEAVPGVIAHR
jgi:hypothetical protein